MHLIPTREGKLMCFNCSHAFEKHPVQERREHLLAQLCTIEDDDHAARAFHRHKASQAHTDASTHVWMDTVGYHIHEVGSVRFMGVEFTLEPGVAPERMLPELDKWLLSNLKSCMIKKLDGTAERERNEFAEAVATGRAPTPPSYDPLLCPDTPAIQELYPFGYVRHANGTVEALPAPPVA